MIGRLKVASAARRCGLAATIKVVRRRRAVITLVDGDQTVAVLRVAVTHANKSKSPMFLISAAKITRVAREARMGGRCRTGG